MIIAVDIGNSVWKGTICQSSLPPSSTDTASRRLPLLKHPIHRLTVWESQASAFQNASVANPLAIPDWPETEQVDRWIENFVGTPTDPYSEPATWLVASVSERSSTRLRQQLSHLRPKDVLIAVDRHQIPMPLLVDQPDRLGIDRLLAAWGAWHLQAPTAIRQPLVVVQVGTAITVDLVNARGEFAGGSIMPGMSLALRALANGTDKLPWLNSLWTKSPDQFPGLNTEQAILGGVLGMSVGGIEWIRSRFAPESSPPLSTILTGGDSQRLLAFLQAPVAWEDQLVLRALALLWERHPLKNSDFDG